MKKAKQKKETSSKRKSKRNTFSKKLANELKEVIIETITEQIIK